MQNFSPATPFKRGVVEPIYCLKTGWSLVRDQYWLFVGMAFVGYLPGQHGAVRYHPWTDDVWHLPGAFPAPAR